eukprot:1927408-Rhodomonas_salina.1
MAGNPSHRILDAQLKSHGVLTIARAADHLALDSDRARNVEEATCSLHNANARLTEARRGGDLAAIAEVTKAVSEAKVAVKEAKLA